MKRNKIKIIRDGTYEYIVNEAETRRTLDLLEESDQFWNGIEALREKYQIPEDGFPEHSKKYDLPGVLSNKDGTISCVDDFFEDAKKLTQELKLPIFWWDSITYFAAYGIFYTPIREPLNFEFVNDPVDGPVVKLVLTERVSKKEFLRLIDRIWGGFEAWMDYHNLPATPKHKMARVALAKEIVRLRDEVGKDGKRLTFGQIAGKLSARYTKDAELSDLLTSEENVRMIYHRWKIKIQGQHSKT